jgi:hypothetical protein
VARHEINLEAELNRQSTPFRLKDDVAVPVKVMLTAVNLVRE